MIQCKKCGDTDISHFYIRKGRNKPYSKCKKCGLEDDRRNYQSNPKLRKRRSERIEERRKEDPLFERRIFLKSRYKISLEDYDNMLMAQNKCCAICSLPEEQNMHSILFVDHDHITGKIRGLLCDFCNRGLGLFKDNNQILEKAIAYLKKVQCSVQ